MRKLPVPPILIIAFGILCASTAAIFIRYAQEYAPSLVIAAWRLSLATLILTPIAIPLRKGELRNLRRRDGWLALLSGFFLAIHFATWITSLQYTSVASSVVLVSTTPLWVALLSPVTIKERPSRKQWIGMAFALAGAVVVGLSDACAWDGNRLACPPVGEFVQGKAFVGDLLALTGAIMAAGYLLIGRSLRARVSLMSYVFIVYGMAAIVLVALMLGAGQPAFGYPPEAYFWFLMLALVPQLLGHSSFNLALGYLSAAYVSISLLGEPIASTILAYVLLGESPTAIKIFGGLAILAGIYIASLSETKTVENAGQSVQPS